MRHTAEVFGLHFPLVLELFVYVTTEKLSKDYTGGSFARRCAEQYYRLRPYAMEHPETVAISAAPD